MPQSFDSIILHLVFSTKERQPFLDETIRAKMHAYLSKIGRENGSTVYKVGGVEDHVHLAITLPRTLSASGLVKELKIESSKWAKRKNGGGINDFAWQAGYGVFSISKSHLPALTSYIVNQETHHATQSFQEEFLGLLRKHDLEWDEAYIWE